MAVLDISNSPWLTPVWDKLQQFYQADRIPHALLFYGASGIGKKDIAHAYAQQLLCEQVESGDACGVCASCKMFVVESHPDCSWLKLEEGATSIKIEQVRSLSAYLSQAPSNGVRKVVVMESAETCQDKSANALLKTLEEPLGNTVIILLSASRAAMPITITSRCTQVAFPMPTLAMAQAWLSQRDCPKDASIPLLYKLSAGAPYQIESWLHNADTTPVFVGLVNTFWLRKTAIYEVVGLWQKKPVIDLLDCLNVIVLERILLASGVQDNAESALPPALHDQMIERCSLDALYALYDYQLTIYAEIHTGVVWHMNRLLYALYDRWQSTIVR